MSQRSELEDKQTVICYGCSSEWIDLDKRPNQKYAKKCRNCGRTNLDNQKLAKNLTKKSSK
jgi:hypothetical protein